MHANKAWFHPPLPDGRQPLLMRLGGLEAVIDYVDGLYDGMLADVVLGPRLKSFMQTAPHDFYMKHLKDRTVDYFEVVWSGDAWEGQDLFAAHMHLNISPDMFDRCMKCGKAKLAKMKISSDCKKEIMDQMLLMKEPITDGDGKFRKWADKRNAELERESQERDLAAGGVSIMGFTMSAAMVKAIEEKKRREEERSKRLAAAREARAREEKEAAKAAKNKATASKVADKEGNKEMPSTKSSKQKETKSAVKARPSTVGSSKKPSVQEPTAAPKKNPAVLDEERSTSAEDTDGFVPTPFAEDLPELPSDGPEGFIPAAKAMKVGFVR